MRNAQHSRVVESPLNDRLTDVVVAASGRVLREVGTSSVVHLPCAPASVALARRALSDELKAAGVYDSAVRDAALVVTELLSNAILHAYPLPGEQLAVAWDVDGNSVEVAVSDGGSATVPRASQPSVASIGGRGLSIVAHLSLTWGVRPNEVGLTVWAVLPAPRDFGAGDHSGPNGPIGRTSGEPTRPWQRAEAMTGL